MKVTSVFSGREGETATGPNFAQSYTLNVDVATGQSVSNLRITDRLPDGLTVTGARITSGQLGTVNIAADNTLTVNFTNPVVGVAGVDASVQVDFFVQNKLAPGQATVDVLGPTLGAATVISNDVQVQANWTPTDPRDSAQLVVVDPAGPENQFIARSLAVQQGQPTITNDVGPAGLSAGDTLGYTITAQVSDYVSLDALKLQQTLSDGQTFNAASVQITVIEGGTTIYNGGFTGTNLVAAAKTPVGLTVVDMDVGKQLRDSGIDGVLTGNLLNGGATTVRITFLSTVDANLTVGTRALAAGDTVGGSVTATAAIVADGTATGTIASDASAGILAAAGTTAGVARVTLNAAVDRLTGDAGDTFNYTITVAQAAGSTASVYDLTLSDFVNQPLILVSQSASIGTLTLTGSRLTLSIAELAPDQQAVLNFTARLANTIEPGSTASNVASLTYDDLPGNGGTQQFLTARAPVVTTVMGITLTETVNGPTLPETANVNSRFNPAFPDLAIGEIATITLVGTLSEGTQQVSLSNTLPAGMTLIPGSVTINTGSVLAATTSGGLTGTLTPTATISGQTVSFNFGYLLNPGNTDRGVAVTPGGTLTDGTITVTFQARVTDTTLAAGTVLTNSSTFTVSSQNVPAIQGGLITTTAAASAEIVRPELTITKTSSLATGDAGDSTLFTVTIAAAPNSSGPAYDLNLTDVLPAGFVLVAGSAAATRGTVTETANGVRLTTVGVTTGSYTPGFALLPADDPATTTIDEGRIVLTFRATLADSVQNGQALISTASYTATSAPSSAGAQSLTLSGNASATVTVQLPLALTQEITAETAPDPRGVNRLDPARIDLSVGEVATHRLVATLGEGTQRVVLTDVLSPGEVFVPGSVVVTTGAPITAGAGGTLTPTAVISADGRTLTLDFGTLVNAGNADGATGPLNDGTITVTFQAQVQNVPANVSGTPLTSTGTVTAAPLDPALAGSVLTQTAAVTSEVVDSALSVTKTASPGFVTPGETLPFTVTVQHTAASTAAAYGVLLSDLITDPNLALVVGTVRATVTPAAGAPALAGTPTILQGNTAGNANVQVSLPVLAVGDVLTVTFDTTVAAATPGGSLLTNTASVTTTDVPPTPTNPNPPTNPTIDSPPKTVPLAPGFEASIASTTNPDTPGSTFTIGEGVTYRLVITLPPGTTSNLVLTDLLPSGLVPTGPVTIQSVGSGLTVGGTPVITTVGQTVTVNFGTVTNGSSPGIGPEDQIVVLVPASVVGTIVDNPATLGFTIDGENGTLNRVVPANVIGPQLTTTATVDKTTGDAGDLFTYTITVAHAAGSLSTAFDLTLTDVLDPRLVPVSATSTNGNAVVTGQTVTLNLASLALGEQAVITVTARMADTVQNGQLIPNAAQLTYDTAAGPGGVVSNANAAAPNLTVQLPLALTQEITAETAPDPRGVNRLDPARIDLSVGEVATHRLVATLGEGTQRVVLTDVLSPGEVFVPGSVVVTTGAPITAGAGGTLTPTAVISADGRTLTLDFGTLVNAGNADGATGPLNDGTITVTFQAQVQNVPANVSGTPLTSTGTVTAAPLDPALAGSVLTQTAAVTSEVVDSALSVTKTASPGFVTPGETLPFTVTVQHTAASTAAAYGVLLSDLITDPNLALVVGTVRATVTPAAGAPALAGTPTILQGNTAGNANVQVSLPVLAVGDVLTVTFDTTVAAATPGGSLLTNTASVTTTDVPPTPTNPNPPTNPTIDSPPKTVPLAPGFEASIASTTNPDTPGSTFTIGEGVTYRLVITLPPGTTSNLVLTDLLPSGLVPTGPVTIQSVGSGLTVGGTPVITTVGQTVTVNFGTVTNGSSPGIGPEDQIVVLVPASVVGTLVDNPATLGFTIDGENGTLNRVVPANVIGPQLTTTATVDKTTGDAGDLFTYTITVAHAAGSLSTAFDLTLTDVLDPRLVPVSATSTNGNAVVTGQTVTLNLASLALGEQAVITVTARMADTVQNGQLIPNAAQLTYDTAAGPGGVVSNANAAAPNLTVQLPLALTQEITAETAPDPRGVNRLDPALRDLSIGEAATYRLVATLGEGTQRVVLTDVLSPGEVFVPGSVVVTTGAPITAGAGGTLTPTAVISADGRTLTLDFGTLVNAGNADGATGPLNDGTITVTFQAQVQNVPANVSGTPLTSTGTVTAAPLDPALAGSVLTQTAAVTSEVVDSALSVTKTASPGFVTPGETLPFTVTVQHTAASTAAAYGVLLSDLITDPNLALVVGTVRATVTPAAGAPALAGTPTILQGNTAGNANVQVSLPVLAVGDVLTVTFDTTVAAATPGGSLLTNTASVTTTDVPPTPTNPNPPTNPTIDSPPKTVPLAPGFEASIASTTNPDTPGSTFTIGEGVTYRLVITLPPGTTSNLVLTDLLPSGLVPTGPVTIQSVGSGLTVGGTPVITTVGQTVTVNFGTVTNGSSPGIGPEDQIVVLVPASVVGTLVDNPATLGFTIDGENGTLNRVVPANVIGPQLTTTATVDKTTGDAGDLFTYTITVAHAAGSLSTAFDLTLTDVLDPRLVPVSATSTNGNAVVTGQTVTLNLASLALGEQAVITVTARMADTVQNGQLIPNAAQLTYDTAAGPGGVVSNANAAAPNLTVQLPLALTQEITAETAPDPRGVNRLDPALRDLSIGEAATYRLVATLGEGTQRVVLTDVLSPGERILTSSVTVATGAGITAGAGGTLTPTVSVSADFRTLTLDFGTLVNTGNADGANGPLNDGTITVTFQAQVVNVPTNTPGTVLTANGTVTSAPVDPALGDNTLRQTATVSAEVVDPQVVLTKTTTEGFANPGDVVPYTLTLRHSAASSAAVYGVVIVDNVPDANLALVAGTVRATLTAGDGTISTLPAPSVVLGNGLTDRFVRVTLPVLAVDDVLTVTFDARVAATAPLAGSVTNTATETHTRVPATPTDPQPTVTAPQTAPITTPLTPGFDASIESTTNPDTAGNNFSPGEGVTYRLVITLPQGRTDNLVLTDLLPAGLTPTGDVRILSVGTGLTVTGTPAITTTGQNVSVNFGAVSNGSGAAIGPEDQIVVLVGATATGPEVDNPARLSFTLGGEDGTLTRVVPGNLVGPQVVTTETVDRTTGDAGDVFTYTITLRHAAGSTATAYDLTLTDVLDPRLVPVSATSTNGNVLLTGQNVTLTLDRLAVGEEAVVTIRARMADTVQNGQTIPNGSVLTYDAVQGPGGLVLRTTSAAPELTVTLPIALTQDIIAESLPDQRGINRLDPTLRDLSIGEVATHRVVATLGEGTQRVVLTDTLTAGQVFVPGSVTVTVGAPITAGAGGTLTPTAVISADGRTLTLDFGTLVNAGNADGATGPLDDGTITVTFQAQVQDVASNVAGTRLTSAATVTSTPADPAIATGTLTANASVVDEVVRSDTILTKTTPPGFVNPGDTLTYTLTLTHAPASTADAYGITITDNIGDPNLSLTAGSVRATVTTASGVVSTISAATIALGNGLTDRAVSVTLPVLAVGDILTVTFETKVADTTPGGTQLTNTATKTTTGEPPKPPTVNSEQVAPGFTASIDSTTNPDTPGSTFAPGEDVVYRLVITLPPGTTSNLVLTDLLPSGLVPTGPVTIQSVGSGLTVGGTPVITTVGQTVTVNFGTVTNGSSPGIGPEDQIVVLVPTRVTGTDVTNPARLDFAIEGEAGRLDQTVPGNVVTPQLTTTAAVDKTSGDAGDVFTYTITVQHAPGSNATAYDLTLTDVLDPRLVPIAASSSTGTPVVLSGQTVTLNLDRLAVGDQIVITVQARMADTVQNGQVIPNAAQVSYDSNPGPGGTPLTASGPAPSLTVTLPLGLQQSIIAESSLDPRGDNRLDPTLRDLAITESATHQLVVNLGEGTQRVVLTNTLSPGETIVPGSVSIVTIGAPITAGAGGTLTPTAVISPDGRTFTLDFGTLVNAGNADGINGPVADGLIVVNFRVQVDNVPANVPGTLLVSAATVTSTPVDPGITTGILTQDARVTAEVVAAELVTTKTTTKGYVNPGDLLPYTITVQHSAASTAAAFGVVLTDIISDPNLALVAGSVRVTVTASDGTVSPFGGAVITQGNGVGDTTVRVTLPLLAVGDVLTIQLDTRVSATIPDGSAVTNAASTTHRPTDDPQSPTTNDRPSDPRVTPSRPGFEASIDSTTNPDTTGNNLSPGEGVVYRLVITLPPGTTDNLVLTDLLPPGLSPNGPATILSTGSGLTLSGTPVITTTGQTASITFGSVTNTSGPAIGAEDQIVVLVPATAIGPQLNNPTTLSFSIGGDPGTIERTVPANLLGPQVVATTTVDRTSGDAGDVLTYTVTLQHAPGSTAPAYDLALTDLLDPRLVPVLASSTAGVPVVNGQNVTLNLDRLALGEQVVLTLRVRLADTVEPGAVITNTPTVAYDTNPGPGGFVLTATGPGPAVTVVLPLAVTQEIIAQSQPDPSGIDRLDPTRPDLSIGEVATHRLVATLGEGTQRVVLTDVLSPGEVFVPGSVVVTTGAPITAGAGGTLTPTAVISADGRTLTLDFGTLVNAGNADGATGPLNDGTITVTFLVRAQDVPGNVSGTVLTSTGTVTASSPTAPGAAGGTVTAVADAAAEVVQPDIAFTKTVDRTTGAVGDVFTYTLTIANTAASTAAAYDLLVSDLLPSGLVLVPGSLTSTAGSAAISGNAITVTIPLFAADAPQAVIRYQATFADTTQPGDVVRNVATLGYGTTPNNPQGPTPDNRPTSETASVDITARFDLGFTKTVQATSLPETGSAFFNPAVPDVAAGETVTYRLTATLSDGTQTLVIRDLLPAGLVPETVQVVRVSSDITAERAPTVTIDGQRVTVDFGPLVNGRTIDPAGSNTVTVDVTARLLPGQTAGTVLTNSAEAEVTSPDSPTTPGTRVTTPADTPIEVVASSLIVTKVADLASAQLGGTIGYTLTVTQAPGSSAPVFGVTIADPISDPSLRLVAGSVAATAGTIVSGNAAGDTGVSVTLPVLLPGQAVSVTFNVTAVGIPPGGQATNTAIFTGTSTPGPVPPGFSDPFSGSSTALVFVSPFNGVSPGAGLLSQFDDDFARLLRGNVQAPTTFIGTAQPGSTVTLEVRDGSGSPVAIIGAQTDVGGHWVAAAVTGDPPPRGDAQATQSARTLAGRDANDNAPPPASNGQNSQPVTGSQPYTVVASQSFAAFDRPGPATDGARITYGGAIQPGGLFTSAPNASAASAVAPVAAAVANDQEALRAPNGVAWNRFALDFAAATAAASVAGR